MTAVPLVSRIPWALAPAALGAAVVLALVALSVPVHVGAVAIVGMTLLLCAAAWALVDLQRFLLIAVLGAMILPISLVQPAGANVALADVLLVVALGAWLIAGCIGAAAAPWTTGNPLLAPTLLFAAVTAASLAWSVQRLETVEVTIQMIEIVVILPLVFASIPRSLPAIRGGLLFFVGFTCILALVTVASFAPRALAGDMTGQYLPGLHKNAIGAFLAAGLVLSYALWLAEARPRVRRALEIAALVELAGLFASVSRGSWLGALFAIVAVSLLLRRRRLLTVGLLVATATTFLLAVGPRTSSDTPKGGGYDSSVVREYSFANAVEKIAERPLLGSGAGTYSDHIPELNIGLRDPNNLFLLTWAEIGLMGLAALLFLLYRFGRLFVSARRLPDAAAVPAVAAGGVTLSLLVHFQVDSTWNRGSASLAFAMMGLVLAAGRLAPGRATAPVPPARGSSRGARPAPAAAAAPAPARVAPLPMPQIATTASTTATAPAEAEPADAGPAAARNGTESAAASGEPRPLGVLHVVTSDAYAGIERHVVRLARELRALGCAAELACPPSADRLRAEARAAGIPLRPSARARPRAWLAGVARSLTARPVDVIHLHDGRAALAGTLLGPLGRGLVVRSQHFTHPASVERTGWRREASLRLHRAMNGRLDGYVAVSQSVADAARERRETGAAQVAIIPPGIELPGEETLARARVVRRETPAPVVAFVGRLEAEKRLDVLLHAVPDVLEELPGCRFVVAGSGGAEQEWRQLAAQLRVEAAVDWLGAVDDAAAVLQSAHVYVNPSPGEGFGLATAEAMAFALPVVAVASGGSAEIVDDGVTGLLVPSDDALALARAIARLAGDMSSAAEMGEAARRRAAARYGADRTARETLAFYQRLGAGARA